MSSPAAEQLALAQSAVEATVIDKITNFLGSAGKAPEFLAIG